MAQQGPTRAKEQTSTEWASRPWLARVIRTTALLAPTAVSFAVTFLLTRHYPPHVLGIGTMLWWVGILLIGLATLLLVDKAARRLLPLAALFKLSLVFPDEAPSRFGTAMKTGTTRQLERRIEEIQRHGIENDETRYASIMLELVAALSVHDRLTRGHCERVRAYTDMMIEELGIAEADASKLRWAALLHDVGKLHVPTAILSKEGRPTEAEWELLKSHTWQGDRLIEPLKPWLGEWAETIGSHHERWDGGGYPNGLKGEDIHLGARIVGVVDAFDVMTSARSYKKPIPAADARAEVARCAGTQFDPRIARAFLNIGLGRLRLAIGPLSWAANIPAAGQGTIAPAVAPIATGATAVATAAVAVVTGGFGGLLTPEEKAPEVVAFADESTTTIATLPPPETTIFEVTTSTIEATTTTGATTTTAAPTTTAPTTTAPARIGRTTTTTAPAPTVFAASYEGLEDGSGVLVLAASYDGAVRFSVSEEPESLGTLTLANGGLVKARTWDDLILSVTQGDNSASTDSASATRTARATFSPSPNAFGTDSFAFTVCSVEDPTNCSTGRGSVTITPVNDAPVAPSVRVTTLEDQPIQINESQILASSSDVDGDKLSVVWGAVNGSGSLTTQNGAAVYSPGPNQNGSATVAFDVCDPSNSCDAGTAVVTVTSVNDAPVIAIADIAVDEDETVEIETAALLGASITDPDDASASLTVTYSPPAQGISIQSPVGLSYTPPANDTSTRLIGVTACDPSNSCTTSSFSISYAAINDAPVAEGIQLNVAEDAAVEITKSDILAATTDPDGDTLHVALLPYSGHGEVVETTATTWQLVPEENNSDPATVNFEVCDAHLCDTVAITVTFAAVNDRPLVIADDLTLDEDEVAELVLADLLADQISDVDNDDSELTITFDTPAEGTTTPRPLGGIDYAPPADNTTTRSITINACDPSNDCGSDTITITYTPVNDAPRIQAVEVSTPEDVAVAITTAQLLDQAEDPEGDTLSAQILGITDGGGSYAQSGSTWTYTPEADYSGVATLSYKVCDPAACSYDDVNVTVTEVNDPPTLDPLGTIEIYVGVAIEPITLAADDIEGDDLTYTSDDLPAGLYIDDNKIVGTPTDAAILDSTVGSTIVVTDDCTPALAGSNIISFEVSPYGLSPYAGQILITEVQGSGGLSIDGFGDFYELTNFGQTTVNLDGWVTADNGPGELPDPFAVAVRSFYEEWDDVELEPGELPVIHSFTNGYIIDGESDDIWLFDPEGLVVDYVAWHWPSSTSPQKGEGVPDALGIWDPAWENDIWTGLPNTSVSLATTTDANTSACWEITGSDDASDSAAGPARCSASDVFLTVNEGLENNSAAFFNYE